MELTDLDPSDSADLYHTFDNPSPQLIKVKVSNDLQRTQRSNPKTSPVKRSPTNTDAAPKKIPVVVRLNVGGVFYTTLRSTLLRFQDSMLAIMFSGRHEMQMDNHGAYFIDRSGVFFGYILDFLRCDMLPPNDVAIQVWKDARYYGLLELEEQMCVISSIASLIVKENHRAQFPDYHEVKKKIIQIAMDNATVSKAGEVLIYAFRQEFIPKAANFKVNHDCVADQAHISVGPWDSAADEETFVRCLENDLIDERFNIKTHEGKRRFWLFET